MLRQLSLLARTGQTGLTSSTGLTTGLSVVRRLVVHFNLKPQIRDHLPGVRSQLARRRQVAVHEQRVRGVEGQRLQGAQVEFPTARDANFRARVEEPEETEDFQAPLRSQLPAV